MVGRSIRPDDRDVRRLRPLILLLSAAWILGTASPAAAAGGHYVFSGGTAKQQGQVKAALDASAFDWNLVPTQIAIHIAPGMDSEATLGNIWLDASLLNAGIFSWGVVQHEYAHQLDFAVLTDAMRVQLHPLLGGSSWWDGDHAALDCERFADLVAWSYWQSPDNVMKPQLAAPRFRAALDALLRMVRARPSKG